MGHICQRTEDLEREKNTQKSRKEIYMRKRDMKSCPHPLFVFLAFVFVFVFGFLSKWALSYEALDSLSQFYK